MRVDSHNALGDGAAVRPAGPDSEVVKWPHEHKTFQEPDEQTIKFLKRLVDFAEKGDLRSIAVACVWRDNLSPSGGTDTGWSRANGCRYALGYSIQQLQHRWCVAMDNPDEAYVDDPAAA